ncbi:pyridoxine biosynthesis protein [Tilletia horrida]|uniref:Pyridoxine biosynthesis protein n=1 Tax=Tilletia horrida TaxID=155126 RepID=A0AAN6GP86_9BASI|nr:pyridoxine biosynthesis protein [Tilletia horrida]KAK0565336.1 pyridoxine biosynthesis protein [Tilletia horrida]
MASLRRLASALSITQCSRSSLHRTFHSAAKASAHEATLFPSVARILAEHSDVDVSKIKGTGIRGMITKGDVLAFLGEVKDRLGSAEGKDRFLAGGGGISSFSDGSRMKANTMGGSKAAAGSAPEKAQPLSASALRSLIISGLASGHESASLRSKPAKASGPSFDSIISGYPFSHQAPRSITHSSASHPAAKTAGSSSAASYLNGLI